MKYLIAYAIGFVAVLFLAGFVNILFSFIVWATQDMTKTTQALAAAAFGGFAAVIFLISLNPTKKP